jgi:hypothetical protein
MAEIFVFTSLLEPFLKLLLELEIRFVEVTLTILLFLSFTVDELGNPFCHLRPYLEVPLVLLA